MTSNGSGNGSSGGGPGRFGLPRGDGDGAPPPGSAPPGGDGDAEELTLSIRGVRAREADEAGWVEVELDTTRGSVTLHMAVREGSTSAVVFLAGAGGGHRGPADEVFVRLGQGILADGYSAIRVQYREAGEFDECVLDALAACSFLKGVGATQAVVVGHSFGGAVAVKAGELSPLVTAVCAMSTQRWGTFEVEDLGKPLLLIHGSRDEVLDKAASEDVYDRAREPKRLVIMEDGDHGLMAQRDEVYALLREFILEHATGVEG